MVQKQNTSNITLAKVVPPSNTTAPVVKAVPAPQSNPPLKPYQGVTSVSKWEKQEYGGPGVSVPPTIPQHPVGSPDANPDPEVIKDTSEAVPKNDSCALLARNSTRQAELASAAKIADQRVAQAKADLKIHIEKMDAQKVEDEAKLKKAD